MKKLILSFIEKYLYRLATERLKNKETYIIAVTGSVGKTSSKEAIKIVLDEFFPGKVFATHGNMNDTIGLPMAVLGFDYLPARNEWPKVFWEARKRAKSNKFPKYLLLEMGVDKPGEISYLTSLVTPDIALITNIGPAHLENFGSLEGVLKEKTELFNALRESGIAIYNHDDERLQKYSQKVKQNKISYGFSDGGTVKGKIVSADNKGTILEVTSNGLKKQMRFDVIGNHLLMAILSAMAVSQSLGLNFDKSLNALKKFVPLAGRMRLIPGIRSITIIDDSYNANPSSVLAALETLDSLKSKGRKVAILGNMNELGKYEERAHELVAKVAAKVCDQLVFVGSNAELMGKVAKENALRGKKLTINIFDTPSRAIISLDEIIKENDTILVKASQNKMRFEKIVEALMLEPEKAKALLVRQDKRWNKKV